MTTARSPLQLEVAALRERIPGFDLRRLWNHSKLPKSSLKNWFFNQQDETPVIADEVRRLLTEIRSGKVNLMPEMQVTTLSDVVPAMIRRKLVRRVDQTYRGIEITEEVGKMLDYCWENSTLGCVIAPFGAGKSHGVMAWLAANPQVPHVVLEFGQFTKGNNREFMFELCEELGIHRGTTGASAFRNVVAELRRMPRLLIFDQCEAMHVSVAQVIRQIWDRTRDEGVGIVILGATVLFTRLNDSRAREIGALTSRIQPWALLEGVTTNEIAGILKAEGITDIDAQALDLLGNTVNGSMRLLTNCIQMLHAKHKGKPVRVDTVRGLVARLSGMRMRKG